MIAAEKVINDLNKAKLILCNPQILTPEMCIKVGQAITSAIDLLKEQEPVKPSRGNDDNYYCGACGAKITNAIKIYDGERYVTSHPDHLKPVNKWLYCKCCGKAVEWDE